MVCVVGLQPTRLAPPHFECGMFSNFITRRYANLKPTSYLIAISSIGSWMMSFCPYITFTIVSLCQWNTIASYGKCLLVIRRCLKLYPVSMSVRCDIDLTVIFKSCRALYCLSIPIPFIMPNRLTGAPYLASRSFARLRPAFMLISFVLRTFHISWWLFIKLHLTGLASFSNSATSKIYFSFLSSSLTRLLASTCRQV